MVVRAFAFGELPPFAMMEYHCCWSAIFDFAAMEFWERVTKLNTPRPPPPLDFFAISLAYIDS